jgi:hypothetical protein
MHREVYTQKILKAKVEALLILLCIGAIIVGACIWFFRFDSPAVIVQEEAPPPFKPAKPTSPETFKP